MNKKKNRIIVCLCLFVFMLSITPLFTSNLCNLDNNTNLETSTINYLFNGKEYDITLDDVYDDENLTKIYTGANFQTSSFNTTIYDWNALVNESVSPVNNTEINKASPSGHFPATYSFENDVDGSPPIGWTGNTEYYEVNNLYLEHSKVLTAIGDGVGGKSLIQNLGGWKTEGTIEWWWNLNDYSHSYVIFNLKNATDTMPHRMIGYGASATPYINVDNGGLLYPTALGWHHYKIDFDCATNLISYWLDDVLILEDKGFRSDFEPDYITSIQLLFSGGLPVGEKAYWDAFGYSWDPYYDIGDNLYSEPITMTNGTFDNTDNMKELDSSYSDFDTNNYQSGIDGDPEYIDSITIDGGGWHSSGVIANTYVDDDTYWRATFVTGGGINLLFDPILGGRDFYISMDSRGSDGGGPANVYFKVNGVVEETAINIDFDDQPYDDVNTLEIDIASGSSNEYLYLYYFKIIEIDAVPEVSSELDFIIENDNLANFDDPDLLSLAITSYHGTNLSETITAKIWNFDSTSYETMFSSSSISVVKNYYSITSNVDDYFDGSGNVKIQYIGSHSSSDFQLNIDYLEFRITYKMDLSHSITFETNGLWKYRWELIGSLQYTDWTFFEVVDPEPNFHAISESDITTRWILQEASLTAVEDFNDDINTNYWNLRDVSEIYFDDFIIESSDLLLDNHTLITPVVEVDYTEISFSTFSQDTSPRGIAWDGTFFWILGRNSKEIYKYTSAGVYTTSHFDVGAQSSYPQALTWDGSHLWITDILSREMYSYTTAGVYSGLIDIDAETGSPNGITWDGTFFWVADDASDEVYKYTSAGVYTGTHFDVSSEDGYIFGITWDGTDFWVVGFNNDEVYKYTSAGVYTGAHFDVGAEYGSPQGIEWDGTDFWVVAGSNVYKYKPKQEFSKNYFGGGYAYIQTNITELISLQSIDYTTHYNLSSGNYFEIDFQTSSDSQIDLILLKDGGINKTLILSGSGNTNFDRHTVQISVDELVEFDQLKISGTLEDTDNVKIYDIKTKKYTLTGDYANFIVGSKRTEKIYLTPDVYNLRIQNYISGLDLVNENITIPDTGVKDYVYTPTATKQCRIAFFNPQDIPLTFTDYHVYINRSLGGSYSLFTLLENIFNVDVDTMVYIEIKDRFNTLIRTYEKKITPTTDYLDIELEVYSLQIKNLMEQKTTLDINSSYVYPLLSGDSIYFILSENYYEIGYYDSDNDYHQFLIYLDSNQAYELNRSKICFLSYADQQGNHLSFDNYKTYINGSQIYENVFYKEVGESINITVNDRHDISVYSGLYNITSGDNYIPITLAVYRLEIINLMNQKTYLTINVSLYEGELGSGRWINFMLSEAYYQIGYYDTNNAYKQFIIYLNSNQVYNLNQSQICILEYGDQQGNHLIFENYKTYLNGSRIYTNNFHREIGDVVGIEIKDRYDISIKNDTLTVVFGVNEKYMVLTMHSLKVFNQQEIYNYVNITRDPNHYESSMYWSEWMFPSEGIEFKLFAGFYVINITNNEDGGSSSYEYELNGDDVILISSGNLLSQVIYNIANVNTTIGNQITNVQIDLTNQNSNINNTIINIDINLSNVNSTLGTLLTNINLDIVNINNNISELYTFTENNFLNLGNNINNSFTLIENNILSINQTISTLVIGLDGKITIVNATITTMFTEMNSQFVVVQSTLDFSFAFLNQTITQIGNNITNNQIALNNLIIQRANDIDTNIIQIQNLINLLNSTVANESLVVQTLVNIIGNNITENHIAINNLISLIGNNITENNVNLINLIELVGNNITTNHFVIQTLIDYVSNNISDNHLEVLTNINFINTTIGQNQIELINRLLFINNSINTMALDLTNQILLVNNTIYSAILDVSVSIDFNSDNILGNISLTYEQNDFLTELYKETMFSSLLNWSDVAFNYSLMENRIDVWEFINDYKNESITVFLRYNEIIDNLTISAQNTIEQYLPNEDVEYRLWSIANEEYLNDWVALPENRTVNFGFYEETIPEFPDFDLSPIWLQVIFLLTIFGIMIGGISYIAVRVSRRNKSNKKKLHRYINKGRDSEAEYYGGKENPF